MTMQPMSTEYKVERYLEALVISSPPRNQPSADVKKYEDNDSSSSSSFGAVSLPSSLDLSSDTSDLPDSERRLCHIVMKELEKLTKAFDDMVRRFNDIQAREDKSRNTGLSRMEHVSSTTYYDNVEYFADNDDDHVTPKQNEKSKYLMSPFGKPILLLDQYMTWDKDFATRILTRDPSLYVVHRLYEGRMGEEFWETLYRMQSTGLLLQTHINLWQMLLLERRPLDAWWTVMPTSLFDCNKVDDWTTFASGIERPSWWTVQRVYFPISIPEAHLLLGELHLDTWTVTIYDSAQGGNYFYKLEKENKFKSFSQVLSRY